MRVKEIRDRLHEIVFEADTPLGKLFDVVLLVLILFSILIVSLESVSSIREAYGNWFLAIEWALTFLFTLEYFLRIWLVDKPSGYIFSFFGIVDLLSVIPTYLTLFAINTTPLIVFRSLRLIRVFRIFKLWRYLGEGEQMRKALYASRAKITVFITVVLTVALIVGTLMYLIEGPQHGFTSIPRGVYWSIVTMTTVGYGDIAPSTEIGQSLAAFLMILGYGIIAVPTGIVTLEYSRASKPSTQVCKSCSKEGHDEDAKYCKYCGAML
ncbi:ion transporter [Sediminitomix flava]|uniref:Voltage-gated potassium channel n=1 Tax=Sediminitomix flava TaxID=379075 RepID=A0A315ZEZ1_SEDFL|nr:ion transporter [Sediminitomix flava]PWJ43730.1 voltage-gated potassium channel [Sediminitomix flava]